MKDVGGCLTRWTVFLQQFNFTIKYKPGKQHGNVDGLSRTPVSDDTLVTSITCLGDLKTIQEAQQSDERILKIIIAVKSGDSSQHYKRYFWKEGLLYRSYKDPRHSPEISQLVIPSSWSNTICKILHDEAGHLGYRKTMEKVKQRYYWPRYEQDVFHWIKECQECQRRNHPPCKSKAPLGTIKAQYPFEFVSWDIMGPLPISSRGYKYILVITDIFSKCVEAFPIRATVSETLANVLVKEVIYCYGVPRYIHSDQGANLCSDVIKSLSSLLGFTLSHTSAYHPQWNGQVERFNRTLEAMLSKVVKENQRDWDTLIPPLLFAYRTAIHEATHYSLFQINFGRSPVLPIDVILGRPIDSTSVLQMPQYVENVHSKLNKAFRDVRHQTTLAHQRNKKRYDKKASEPSLKVGDCVWLLNPAINKEICFHLERPIYSR